MPLKKPTTFFEDKKKEESKRLAEAQESAPARRFRSPSEVVGDVAETASFVTPRPVKRRTRGTEDIVERINELADVVPEDNKLWEHLSGIERSISSLHMDKLERAEALQLSEDIESLRQILESLPEVKYYEGDIAEAKQSAMDEVTSLREDTELNVIDINDRIIQGVTRFDTLKEKVDSLVIPDLKGKEEDIIALRGLHSELQEAVADIPNQKSRFDPTPIIESLSALRDNLTQKDDTLSEGVDAVNARIDSLPEIRHYEDDLDLLQNFITDVKESIKYYDTDVDEIKSSILDLGKHLGETINNKVKKLSRDAKKIEKNLSERVESLPEVKYYDDEITVIEGKIHNLLQSINDLPEVKYYDEDVKSLSEAIDKLNNKIDSIKIPDWTDAIEKIRGEVSKVADIQKDFDQRWEDAAKDKDPLLDPDNFVTFEDMQKHYRDFLQKVQIQLGTIGGGGAVEVMEMDDIGDDIKANPQDFDNYFLQHKWDPVRQKSYFTAQFIDLSLDGVTGNLGDLEDIDLSDAVDGSLLIYDASMNGFRFVTPQSIGINNDFNPDPEIEDYGTYE